MKINYKHSCHIDNAPKFADWIANRGGVAVWKSIALSDPGKSMSSPATIRVGDCNRNPAMDNVDPRRPEIVMHCPKCGAICQNKVTCPAGDYYCDRCNSDLKEADLVVAYPKPSWKVGNTPAVITDPADIEVYGAVEVKRFRVGIRMGGNGLSLKVTDGGSNRIRREVAKAGDGAYYEFDYVTQEAVIFKTTSLGSLKDWIKKNKRGEQ